MHGLRHGHKTWMAEDGIPEILAEQRLGHQVPGMRGLYAHTSGRMRDDLKHALQTRWEDSLRARAAIAPRSPVPLLDELLTAEVTHRNQATPGDREKMISQNPPNRPRRPARPTLAIRGEPELTASDLARYLKTESGAKGTRTPDPLLAKQVLFQLSYSPATAVPGYPVRPPPQGAVRAALRRAAIPARTRRTPAQDHQPSSRRPSPSLAQPPYPAQPPHPDQARPDPPGPRP